MIKACLQTSFESVTDPRSIRNQKHPFMMLMGTTLLSYLSGIESFSGVADFVSAHHDELQKYFDFPHGTPSHDTYQRFWDAINPEQFYASFSAFTATLATLNEGVISIDGKTIRHSGYDNPLHIVSAWCQANQLTLAQEKVDDKSNEIMAIPKLLKLLDLHHRIVTIDAMGTQREIAQQIIDQGGNYVLSVKGNQPTLFEDIKLYFEDPEHCKTCLSFAEYDKGHGRIESRIAYVTEDIAWLQEHHKWPGLRSISMVISNVIKKGKETTEKRFYISSRAAQAEELNKTVRSHWSVENQLHWRLDVVFNEDGACVRNDNAAENMDILRKWALNILHKAKAKPDQSIKSIMRKNAMSFKHLRECLEKIFHA